jgi:hypothetical protein
MKAGLFIPLLACCLLAAVLRPTPLRAAEEISLAEGQIKLTAPEKWQKKQPRTRIVEFEFAAPAADGDDTDGRLTIMGAGGSVEQNVQRWIGQFTQPDGKETSEVTKSKDLEVGGAKVRTVDISGTYRDQAGPMAPAVMREDYRMLGAIVVTPEAGNYFLKFYGPKNTIAAHEEAFHEMVKSIKLAKVAE